MNMGKDWRIETDGLDYFRSQKKTLEVADRRPVIRKASDLVGPGIGANTTSITNFNDLLATFNGYYSSEPGADNAPNETEAFVGQVISDALVGGTQVFTGLESETEYRRTFARSTEDPEALSWSPWRANFRIPPTARGYAEVDTEALTNQPTLLVPPNLTVLGAALAFERTEAAINLRLPGVYTGSVQVGDRQSATTATVAVWLPTGNTTEPLTQINVPLAPTVHIPFTVWATDPAQSISVTVQHSEATLRNLWWRFSCTRVGDAV